MASDGKLPEANASFNPQAPFAEPSGLERVRETLHERGMETPRSQVGSDRHIAHAANSSIGSIGVAMPAVEQQPRQSRGSPSSPAVRMLGAKSMAVPGPTGMSPGGYSPGYVPIVAVPSGMYDARTSSEFRGDAGVNSSAPQAGEVYDRVATAKRVVTQYRLSGRFARQAITFTSDMSVGKFGVLGDAEAEAVEQRLFVMLNHDDFSICGKSEAFRNEFLLTLRLFLAINSGSIGNTVGRMGVRDDSQPLCFQDAQISAADVASVLGDRAYAYMRARATEIRDTIEAAFATSTLPNAEREFPGVCRAVDLIKVVAAAKGISQYPQYAAVGSEYAVGTPPYLISLIKESASKVLNSTQGNVRESSVAGSGAVASSQGL